MLIVCPSCETSYTVQPISLPPHGQVRCLRCHAVWSPQRDQADKLLAAAAAIADEFAALPEPDPGEESTSQPGDWWDDAAPYCEPELFAETAPPNADPGSYVIGEGAHAKPEADCSGPAEAAPTVDSNHSFAVAQDAATNPDATSSLIPEIVFVDLEPDHSLLAADDGAANPAPEFCTTTENAAHDPPSDGPADMYDDDPDAEANVARLGLEADAEPDASVSEAAEFDEEIGLPSSGQWLSDHLISDLAGDETPPGDASDIFEEEPSADTSEEGESSPLQFAEEPASGAAEDSEYEAPLSAPADPEIEKRAIDLKADYPGTASSENVSGDRRRTDTRSRRKIPVRPRRANVAARRFMPRWPLSNLHTGILALALVDCLLVGWRTDIVRKLPQTASFYALAGLPVNLRGLAFDGITTNTVSDDGTPILVVEGNIINDTRKVLRVPQLRLAVRDSAAQEIYSWTASAAGTSLPPGQAVAFRTRLAAPPAAAHDVVLRFVNRRDVVGVTH